MHPQPPRPLPVVHRRERSNGDAGEGHEVTLRVFTARVSYCGPSRLDITRKGNDPDGVAFAPSWPLLNEAMAARHRAEDALKGAHRDHPVGAMHREAAHRIEEEMWQAYAPRYVAEMRASYVAHRGAWDAVLRREVVTLVCFCDLAKWPGHCHRVLCADLLARCGAARGIAVELGGECGW